MTRPTSWVIPRVEAELLENLVLRTRKVNKLWMSPSLYLESFFGPTAGQLQGLLASGCRPTGGPSPVWMCPCKKRRLRSRHIHRGTPMWGHSRKGRYPRRNQLCQQLDLGLLASRTVRKYISVVLSHPVYSSLFFVCCCFLAFIFWLYSFVHRHFDF